MTESEYRVKKRKIELENQQALWKRELKELKNKYKKPKFHIETSKVFAFLIMLLIFANAVFIENNTFEIIKVTGNYESLDTLIKVGIGSSFAMVLNNCFYFVKAYCAKREEENIKLEREKLDLKE